MRCPSNKKTHATEEDAHKHKEALAEWNAKTKRCRNKSLNVYWCATCTFFHVGHSNRPPQQKPTSGE